MTESIFTKIINKEIPGEVLYEDVQCYVLLTIQPFTEGHMLVVPRDQVDHLWDIDDETYHHLFDVAKWMQDKLAKAYDYERVGLLVEGFGVPHAHIHVFGYEKPLEETMVDHIAWKRSLENPVVDADTLHAVAEKLRAA